MIPLFADTAYFIALLNPEDSFHAIALSLTKNAARPLRIRTHNSPPSLTNCL